jgi:hypothetical protein
MIHDNEPVGLWHQEGSQVQKEVSQNCTNYAENVMMDSSWMLEQEKLKSQVICYDMYNWQHKR